MTAWMEAVEFISGGGTVVYPLLWGDFWESGAASMPRSCSAHPGQTLLGSPRELSLEDAFRKTLVCFYFSAEYTLTVVWDRRVLFTQSS